MCAAEGITRRRPTARRRLVPHWSVPSQATVNDAPLRVGRSAGQCRHGNCMSVSEIGLVLLVACVVAMLSRRLRLPYSVGLVIAGIGLAFAGGATNLALTPQMIYTMLLPPLIFEAALQLEWRPF